MHDKPKTHQPVNEAEIVTDGGSHNSGGDALLDAEVEARKTQEGDPIPGEPKATNVAGNTDPSEATGEKNYTTTGNYPAEANRLEESISSQPLNINSEG